MELTVAKMGGTGVIDTGTKMGGAHCGKKVVELSMTKMDGALHDKN